MQYIINKIVNIDKNEITSIRAVENDMKTRFVNFQLLANNQPLDLTGLTIRVYGKTSKGTEVFNDLNIIDSSKGLVQLELTRPFLVAGLTEYQLKLYTSDNGVLSSNILLIDVTKDLMDNNSIEASNEYKSIEKAFQQVDDSINRINNAIVDVKANQIGGTNLLDLTGYPLSLDNFESNSGKIDIVNSPSTPFTQKVYCIMNDRDSERLAFWNRIDFPIIEDTHITESCYMYIDENVVSAELFCLAFDGTGTLMYAQPTAFDIKGKWFKAINTVMIPKDKGIKTIQFRVDNNGVNNGKSGGVYFFYPKLERGTLALDFSPNPKDWKKEIGNGTNLLSPSNCILTADRIAFPNINLKPDEICTLNMGNIKFDGTCLNLYKMSDDYTNNDTKPLQTILDWGNIKGIYTFETNSLIPDEELYFVFWGGGINDKYSNSNKKIKLEEGSVATPYCDSINNKLEKATIGNAPGCRDCNWFLEPNSRFVWDTGLGAFKNTPIGDLSKDSGIVFEVINYGSEGRIQQEFRQTYPYYLSKIWVRNWTSDNSGQWSDWRSTFEGENNVDKNTDFNNLTRMGCYKVQGITPPTPNGPLTLDSNIYGYGLLNVYQSGVNGENRTLQIYYPHMPGGVGHRTPLARMLNSGGWTAWDYIGATSKDINTLSSQVSNNSGAIQEIKNYWLGTGDNRLCINGRGEIDVYAGGFYFINGTGVSELHKIDHSHLADGQSIFFAAETLDQTANIKFCRDDLVRWGVYTPHGADFWITGRDNGDVIFEMRKMNGSLRFMGIR